jgi:hypothetical protein
VLTFANSSTRGALNAQFSGSTLETVGPETHVVTLAPTLANETLSGSWIQGALGQLDDIAKLGPNWDSYGADPPSPLALAIASKLLLMVDRHFGRLVDVQSQPQVVAPRADGGIQIEWGTRPVTIAVHTDPSGNLGYLYVDRRGDTPKYAEVPSAPWGKVLELIAKVIFTATR